jgi:hypothetical protein
MLLEPRYYCFQRLISSEGKDRVDSSCLQQPESKRRNDCEFLVHRQQKSLHQVHGLSEESHLCDYIKSTYDLPSNQLFWKLDNVTNGIDNSYQAGALFSNEHPRMSDVAAECDNEHRYHHQQGRDTNDNV